MRSHAVAFDRARMNERRSIAITIRGRVSGRLAEAFDGMRLERSPRGTLLVGQVADQAQLHGLLARIRDLGLELESVTTSEPSRTGPGPEAST